MIEFLRRNFRWIAGGFTLTFFSSFGQTYFISASVAEWRSVFDLSHGEFGRLYMLATLGSAACLPFLGRVLDFVRPHTVIAFVIPLLALAALVAGFATSLPVLVAAIFALRLFGQGMMTHTSLTTTGRWFAAERGRAISLVVLGHQGGEATIPLAFASIAIVFGFQAGWVAAAGMLLLVGLPISYWCYRVPRVPLGRVADEGSTVAVQRSWTRREVLGDAHFWLLLTGTLAPAFIGTIIFYHQNYLTELNNWPASYFASSLILLAGTTVIIALITGALVDRFGAVPLLPVFLVPLAASCFALAGGGSFLMLTVVMLLLGVSYGIASTLFGSLWPEVYGVLHLGAVRSVTVSAAVLASAVGPGLTGTLIDTGMDLPQQMRFFGAYCLLAAAILSGVSWSLRRRAARESGAQL